MDKPLPCPFCGCENIIAKNPAYWHYAWCTICGAIGPLAHSQAEAVSKWNTRAASQPTGDTYPRYGVDDGPDALEDA